MFSTSLKKYNFEVVFVDDFSKDNTRDEIRKLCEQDKEHVKAVFNSTNF
ncbi:glycosyltransferase [bacterium]|nr:glycosyltransferase [bacterium]